MSVFTYVGDGEFFSLGIREIPQQTRRKQQIDKGVSPINNLAGARIRNGSLARGQRLPRTILIRVRKERENHEHDCDN